LTIVEDDLTAILTWQGGVTENYIVRWGPADFSANITSHWMSNMFQIQPMVAGVQYFAQVASGSTTVRTLGNWSDWSEPVYFQSNSARVDALRASAAFFDDFNTISAGGLDARVRTIHHLAWTELMRQLWNTVHSYCNDPYASATFINSQNHAHNLVKGGFRCAAAATTARARHQMDFSTGTQQLFFDFDFGISGAYWFLDFHAQEHFELSPTMEEAGGMDVNGKTFFFIHQHGSIIDLVVNRQKVTANLPMRIIPNVRRRVVVVISARTFKMTIDNAVVFDLAVAFPFTKATIGFRQTRNRVVASRNAAPDWATVHWDNFGFTSATPVTIETHSYVWKPTSVYQLVGKGLSDNVLHVAIPDSLKNAVAVRLMYHVVHTTLNPWSRWDNVTVNGKPIFMFNQSFWKSPKHDWKIKTSGSTPKPVNFVVPLKVADLSSVNTIEFKLRSQYQIGLQRHGQLQIEVDFPKDAAPAYTQPATWFHLSAPAFHPLSKTKVALAAQIISVLGDSAEIQTQEMDDDEYPAVDDIANHTSTSTTMEPTPTGIQAQAIITGAPGLKHGFVSIVPPLLDQGTKYSRASIVASRANAGVIPIRFLVENTRIVQAFGRCLPITRPPMHSLPVEYPQKVSGSNIADGVHRNVASVRAACKQPDCVHMDIACSV